MRTLEEKMLAVAAWRSSELSQNEYCKTLGLKRTTFANWVSRNKRKKVASNFVRVTVPAVMSSKVIERLSPQTG